MNDTAEIKKPVALRAGARLGVCAPSGSVSDPGRVAEAAGNLRKLGFEVMVSAGCAESYGYLAGSDETRARDLNALFADPEIDGIICLKGGYGTPRILDLLDWDMFARNPKAFIGYSDITAIHLGLYAHSRLASFHGPMPSSDMIPELDDFSAKSLLAAIGTDGALGRIENPHGRALECLVPGRAEGRLIGGNLSLVAATIGTPWQIDARGAILFLEDIDEAPYRVDRMLTQLRLAGVFRDCRGIVLGDWNNCRSAPGKKSLELGEVFRDVLPQDRPVLANLAAGHCQPKLTLPLGVRVGMDAKELRLEYLESATR